MNNRFDNKGREQNIAQGERAVGRQTNIFLQPLKPKTIAALLALVAAAMTGAGIIGWHLLTPSQNNITVERNKNGTTVIASGNVTLEGIIPPELFAKYVKDLGATEAVVNGFFVTLLEHKVPRDQWDSTLRKIADQHKGLLLQQPKSVKSKKPEMVRRKEEIRQTITKGDYAKARYLLGRAELPGNKEIKRGEENTVRDDIKFLSDASRKTPSRKHSTLIWPTLPPAIDLLAPADGSGFRSPILTLRYRVRIHDNGPPVTALQVQVDGRFRQRSKVTRRSATEWEGSVDVTLPAKDMLLSLIAENKQGAMSQPATINLHWQGNKDALKPVLYLLAVGVDSYDAPEINLYKGKKYLKYAGADARAFATLMMQQAGPGRLYREVKPRVLINEQADQDAVLEGLEWIDQQTTANDVAMVFFAGNGKLDSHGDYYFLPKDFKPWHYTRSGVSYDAINRTVTRLRGKALFLIDTCYSGRAAELRGRGNDKVDINLSATENGTVILSATTGQQTAQERDEWGHGAFTKALLEALGGNANYVKDKAICISEINTYLAHRVPELTDGQQTPAVVIPRNVPDFPVVFLP